MSDIACDDFLCGPMYPEYDTPDCDCGYPGISSVCFCDLTPANRYDWRVDYNNDNSNDDDVNDDSNDDNDDNDNDDSNIWTDHNIWTDYNIWSAYNIWSDFENDDMNDSHWYEELKDSRKVDKIDHSVRHKSEVKYGTHTVQSQPEVKDGDVGTVNPTSKSMAPKSTSQPSRHKTKDAKHRPPTSRRTELVVDVEGNTHAKVFVNLPRQSKCLWE